MSWAGLVGDKLVEPQHVSRNKMTSQAYIEFMKDLIYEEVLQFIHEIYFHTRQHPFASIEQDSEMVD